MSAPAKVFVAAMVTLGALAMSSLVYWQSTDLRQFFVFTAVAILASGLKVKLPGILGTMSVNFFFIVVGIVEMSLQETLVLGSGCILFQYFWKKKQKTQWVKVTFNLATTAAAIRISHWVFHSSGLREWGLEFPLLMVLTTTTYFLSNTIPIATIISLTERKNVVQVWRDCYFWSFAYYLVGAVVAIGYHWINQTAGWQSAISVLPVVYFIYHSYKLYLDRLEGEKNQAENQRKHAEEMSSLHLRTIEALALAIEAKDQTTHDHLGRVQVYAVEVAKELGLDHSSMEAVRAAALLHDIGKLAVPEHIISKPGRLTPEEFEKMKIHPVVGAEILDRVQFPYPVVPVVRHHHEKWDGTGYPDGLAGEDIPMGARIIAAVDCLDALASDRQYRRALPLDEAMEVVRKQSGTAFDPRIVDILWRRYKDLEVQARAAQVDLGKLSTDLKIERGDAPAAGFVGDDAKAVNRSQPAFLSSIGAARHEAQVLFEMVQAIGSSLSLTETLSVVALRLEKLVPHHTLAVYIRQEECVTPAFVTGDEFRLFQSLRIPIGQGLSGWVAESSRPMLNGNPSVEPGYLNDPAKFSNLRSALSVPLEGTTGTVGVLTLYHGERDHFTPDHLRILLAIASKLGVCVENSLKYQQAEDNATVDYLTELPNARSLFEHLENELQRATNEARTLGVLVGDLNGFKAVNDHYGHLEGNRILQVVARNLRAACREKDYVARMGGDEFVVVIPDATSEGLQPIWQRLAEAVIAAGVEVCGNEAVSLAAGEAFLGADGCRAEELLAAADKRMYANKIEMKRQKAASQDLARLAEKLNPGKVSSTEAPAVTVRIKTAADLLPH